MQLTLLVVITLLATVAIADDEHDGFTEEELKEKYKVIQRQRENAGKEAGKITTKVRYIHHHQSDFLPESVAQDVSDSYIECAQGELDSNLAYDFPLQVGWLYSSFNEGDTPKKYFDTSESEHWAFPNFSCNSKHVLAAVSWMRSGKNSSFKKNKDLHSKFKDHKPPFYSGTNYFNNKRKGGVYCNWDGWLYPSSNINYKYFIDTNLNNELFTLLNVYCHRHSYVRMFYTAQASNDQQVENNLKPFADINPPSQSGDSNYPSVLCNWDGWLYGDMSGNTWSDSADRTRFGYEKYFAIDTRRIYDSDKEWMKGRVANPFCSRKTNQRYGVVTVVRAFCFFSIKSHTSENIKKLRERYCQGL